MKKVILLLFLLPMSQKAISCCMNVKEPSKCKFGDSTIKKYYICIKGVKNRNEINQILKNVSGRVGVLQFSNSGPVEYFFLKTKKQTTPTEFQSWIGEKYPVMVFGDTQNDLRKAFFSSRKGEIHND